MSDWISTRETWPKINECVRARYGNEERDVIAHFEFGWIATNGDPLPVPDAWKPRA